MWTADWRAAIRSTSNTRPKALHLAIDFAGPDHILAGSDYPHRIGSLEKMLASLRALEKMLASLRALDVSEPDRANILGGNAARLLGI